MLPLSEFRKEIAHLFSKDELKTLAFDLKIDWEELHFDTKSNAIISLLKEIGRRQLMEKLLSFLESNRPNIDWNKFSAKSLQVEVDSLLVDTANKTSLPSPILVAFGARHKRLREKYLKLNAFDMASFYGIGVTRLEKYEEGYEQFPPKHLRKLQEHFFVSSDYLEKGEKSIFISFSVSCDNQIDRLLKQNFQPYFLCNESDRNWLTCYPMLYKYDEKYPRTIVAAELASFKSKGGGKNNILKIITAMLRNRTTYANIVKVNANIWDELQNRQFYFYPERHIGVLDVDCSDIFDEWFEKELTEQKRLRQPQKRFSNMLRKM